MKPALTFRADIELSCRGPWAKSQNVWTYAVSKKPMPPCDKDVHAVIVQTCYDLSIAARIIRRRAKEMIRADRRR